MLFRRPAAVGLLLATTALAAPLHAQDAPPEDSGDIIVTAQKRSESLQAVPISIQALGTKKLEELNISNFAQYAQQLPSVSFQALGGTPGTNVVYMRGVASGGDGNHSGSLPSVGVYLDEQPVTTIGGNLDVHVYDIARIESLSGPQGTLYGASSEAGTIRIITNKPDLTGFYGQADGELNTVSGGGVGGKFEAMLNMPFGDRAALRLVGFYQHDAGFIDNVAGTRTFIGSPTQTEAKSEEAMAPLSSGAVKAPLAAAISAIPPGYDPGISVNNAAFVKEDYNETDIVGGRAALRVELDDNWTVTPTIIYQNTRSNGSYGYDPQVGDLKVQHFFPERRSDKFYQAALTIEGKIGNWDLTYAGAYLDRRTYQESDYTDYAEAYDSLYQSVGGLAGYFYFLDNGGNVIDPRQWVVGSDHFKKMSQEIRISSPSSAPLRVVGGLFYQRQSNAIHQDYKIANLADLLSVNGQPGTVWLTQQHRIDKDYAAFGEVSYDIVPTVTVTAGVRVYKYDNSLIGFFGFGRDPAFIQGADNAGPPNAVYSTRTGVAGCYTTSGARLREAQLAGQTDTTLLPAAVDGSPCTNLATFSGGALAPVKAEGDGATYRFNARWKPNGKFMVYATWSKGFRPGGINRRADVAPYGADELTNYELGTKLSFLGGMVRVNAAVYHQDWKSFQFAFLGANSFTEIHNGPNASIDGFEGDVSLNTGGLTLSSAFAYTSAKTEQNLCLFDDPGFTCADTGNGNMISAPKGTRLPITPEFKINGTARYTAPVGQTAKAYGQVVVSYQSSASSDIRTAIYETFSGNVINPAAQLGRLPAFASVDLALGANVGKFNFELFAQNLFDERGQISRFQQCGACGQRPYIVPITPRTVGLRVGTEF